MWSFQFDFKFQIMAIQVSIVQYVYNTIWEITYQASDTGSEPRQVIPLEGQQMQSNDIFTHHEITNLW